MHKRKIDYRAYDHPMGLVLTRKHGERIELDDGNSRIVITLLGSDHGRASLAVFCNHKSFKISRLDVPKGAVRREQEEGNGPHEPREV